MRIASPGRAPARPGTRCDRPSAVTVRKTIAASTVSPPRTGTPASAIPSYSSSTASSSVSPGTPRLTSNASGRAPDAARSLMLTAAAPKPSSRQESQSSRKWTPSTTESCVTTRPSPRAAASFSICWARPRRSSSASRPSSPSSDSRTLERCANRTGIRCRPDDGDAGGACFDAKSRVGRIDPADRDHRRGDAFADFVKPFEAERRTPRLDRRRTDRADAEVVGTLVVGDKGFVECLRREPDQQACLACALEPLVLTAEVDAVSAERDGCLDVVVDDKRHARLGAEIAKRSPRLDPLERRGVLEPKLHERGSPLDRDPRDAEVVDEGVQDHRSEERRVGKGGVAR